MRFPLQARREHRYLGRGSLTRHGTQRDSQRSRLYKAERAVPLGREFRSIGEVREYVDALVGSEWWQERFRVREVTVGDGRGRRSACGYPTRGAAGKIKLPCWSRKEMFVLHELAHVLVGRPHAWHGRLFANVLLLLVQHQMGHASYVSLREAFRRRNIRWKPDGLA